MKTFFFKTIKKVVYVTFILNLMTFGFSAVVGYVATKPERELIDQTPHDYQMFYENVSFKSSKDNVLLQGWWIPSQSSFAELKSDKTIIFSHGFGNSRLQKQIHSLKLAKVLTNQGYNVLLFDFRNSGESGGSQTTVGLNEKYDLLGAIQFATDKKESNKIGLIGWSMGAATSILAASESNLVSVVVADSPFSDLERYLEMNLSYWTKIPDIFSPIILKATSLVTPLKPNNVVPYEAADKFKDDKGLLLIHGKNDRAIPYSESQRIYKSIDGKKRKNIELWLTEDAGHIRSYNKEKEKYEYRILTFISHFM